MTVLPRWRPSWPSPISSWHSSTHCGPATSRSACTVLYCTVLYCTVLHCTVLYCTVVQVCDTRIPGKRWEALGHGPQRFPTAYNTEELPGEEWQDDVHKFTDPSIQYAA